MIPETLHPTAGRDVFVTTTHALLLRAATRPIQTHLNRTTKPPHTTHITIGNLVGQTIKPVESSPLVNRNPGLQIMTRTKIVMTNNDPDENCDDK